MNTLDERESRARLRLGVYGLLITLAAGSLMGRILAVDSIDRLHLQRQLEQRGDARWIMRPFLSSNDRSRWATVRSLVEHGTYEIDPILFLPDPPGAKRPSRYPREDPLWDTIDKVRHQNRQGEWKLYSSKPPLLATLLAGEYWVIHKITGATMFQYPYDIGRFMLITVNVLPLMVCFLLLARLVERFGTTDWGKMFVVAAATFATFLTTFGVTLNNHVPAAVSATIAVYAAVRIWYDAQRRLRYFAAAGFFAAFTAANELPALSLFAAVSVALLYKAPKQTLMAYAPAALVVVAAFFGTNKLAHDSWRPPYAHRSPTDPADNWYDYEYFVQGASGPIKRESYWRDHNKIGVDRGEPSHAKYAFHVLLGHHGIFSLTPIWLFSLLGAGMMIGASRGNVSRDADDPPTNTPPPSEGRGLAVMVLALSAVCLTFYLLRPLADRNYGGVTSGFRWMFWFTPLWLILMIPAADWLSLGRRRRLLALVLLGASALSAAYPTWNPWVHPWIYEYMRGMGLVH